jgi:hypothetical protein
MTHAPDVSATRLPAPVRSYLDARAAGDVARALSTFSPTAEVTDDGRTYRGAAAIRTFLTAAGSQYTYTTTLTGAERVEEHVWIAHHRIQGDFPGGVADLSFRFELSSGSIASLRITA